MYSDMSLSSSSGWGLTVVSGGWPLTTGYSSSHPQVSSSIFLHSSQTALLLSLSSDHHILAHCDGSHCRLATQLVGLHAEASVHGLTLKRRSNLPASKLFCLKFFWGRGSELVFFPLDFFWCLIQGLPGCGDTALKTILMMQVDEAEGSQWTPKGGAATSLEAQNTYAPKDG